MIIFISIFLIPLIIVAVPYVVISAILFNKKQNRIYEIVDTYLISKGTPIYYKSYRHITIYYSRLKNEKAINLYLSNDGRYLETVAKSLIDKELTELDKDVFVLRLEDAEQNYCMISYDISRLDNNYVEYLFDLNVGETIILKDVLKEQNQEYGSFSTILTNEHHII